MSFGRQPEKAGSRLPRSSVKTPKRFGDRIEIPAHYWPHLKRTDDQLTGKAILSDDQGRVYREVQFPRLDVKELWPKSPPLSGEPLEHVEKPEPEHKASRAGVAGAKGQADHAPKERPQSKRAKRYIEKHYPDGTDGISTAAIRRKLAKDKDLQAELEKEGGTWGVPSATVINRVLGRRKK